MSINSVLCGWVDRPAYVLGPCHPFDPKSRMDVFILKKKHKSKLKRLQAGFYFRVINRRTYTNQLSRPHRLAACRQQPSHGRLYAVLARRSSHHKCQQKSLSSAASQPLKKTVKHNAGLRGSPLFWLTRGHAVLDGFAVPIVGEGDTPENEHYVEQLALSAEAAVAALHARGVSDHRLAVGGHSYGAFMTANLLARTRLFAAGIARRNGAYNRTLTPFGFQSEERHFWEAPETYAAMSPFHHADKIRAPLLLIHSQADPNPGTFPNDAE